MQWISFRRLAQGRFCILILGESLLSRNSRKLAKSRQVCFLRQWISFRQLAAFSLKGNPTSSQAPSYAGPKLRLTESLTGVKCRATSVAKNEFNCCLIIVNVLFSISKTFQFTNQLFHILKITVGK